MSSTKLMHRKNKKFRKIGLISPSSEIKVLSSLIISIAELLIEERTCAKFQKCDSMSSASCVIFIDLLSKPKSNKESFNSVHHKASNRGQYGLIAKK